MSVAAMPSRREIDCLICGTCVADILVKPLTLSEPLQAGRFFHVEPIGVTSGGIVCNAGTAMQRLGLRVAASSLVGNDLWAGVVRAHLEAEGIDIQAIQTHPQLATSTTAVLVDSSGERIFAHHVGAPQELDLHFIQSQAGHFARSRLAIIGYFGLLPKLESTLAAALILIKQTGCAVAVETGGDGGAMAAMAPALPHIDYYVPSLEEAVHQTGLSDPRLIVDCYRRLGATGLVGVKLGVRGAFLSPSAGEYFEIPCVAAPGPLVDTTGAGDSFLAGLLAGVLRGLPIREAAILGAATAACCVTGRGATAGLRSLSETMQLAQFSKGGSPAFQ